jgi:hypothetical protein
MCLPDHTRRGFLIVQAMRAESNTTGSNGNSGGGFVSLLGSTLQAWQVMDGVADLETFYFQRLGEAAARSCFPTSRLLRLGCGGRPGRVEQLLFSVPGRVVLQ